MRSIPTLDSSVLVVAARDASAAAPLAQEPAATTQPPDGPAPIPRIDRASRS